MGDPLSRLYSGDAARNRSALERLPVRRRAVLVDADIDDEHLAAFAVWCVVGCPVAAMTAWLVGPWAGISVVVLLAALPVTLVVGRRGRRARRLVAALPTVVEMIGRSLRTGASFVQALAETATDAPPVAAHELRRVIAEIQLGRTATQALQAWAGRDSAREVRIVAAALAMASENESGTSQALAGVAQSLRDRVVLAAEIRTHASQAVASMYAMVLLPAAFLMVDLLGSRRTTRFLLSTRIGRVCLVAAVVLDVAGWLWMRATVRRRLPT